MRPICAPQSATGRFISRASQTEEDPTGSDPLTSSSCEKRPYCLDRHSTSHDIGSSGSQTVSSSVINGGLLLLENKITTGSSITLIYSDHVVVSGPSTNSSETMLLVSASHAQHRGTESGNREACPAHLETRRQIKQTRPGLGTTGRDAGPPARPGESCGLLCLGSDATDSRS